MVRDKKGLRWYPLPEKDAWRTAAAALYQRGWQANGTGFIRDEDSAWLEEVPDGPYLLSELPRKELRKE